MGIGTGIGIRRSHRLELLLRLRLVHLLRLGRCERREHRLLLLLRRRLLRRPGPRAPLHLDERHGGACGRDAAAALDVLGHEHLPDVYGRVTMVECVGAASAAAGTDGSQPAPHGTAACIALHAYCRSLGCTRSPASGKERRTSSLKLSRRVRFSAGGGGGGGSGAVVLARTAPRLAGCLRSFFLGLSHGCSVACHGEARHQGVLDAGMGWPSRAGRRRPGGAKKKIDRFGDTAST